MVLHGGGEIGNDNEAQLVANDMVTGFASNAEQAINKAYVVAPQLPAELKVNVDTTGKKGWSEEKVKSALMEINYFISRFFCSSDACIWPRRYIINGKSEEITDLGISCNRWSYSSNVWAKGLI